MHYGFDIGGTKIEIAAMTADYEIVFSERVATPTDSYRAFLDTIVGMVQDCDQKLGCRGTVGIGVPGVVNETGLLKVSNIPCANGQPLQKDLEARLNRPVVIENDCRCFTLSEACSGAAKNYPRVFGAIFGTGIGGCLCLDRNIYDGRAGIAGEWGHMPIAATVQQRYNLPLYECGCGQTSCYERYMAGPGVARLYRHFGGEDISTPEVISRYRAGESVAVQTFTAFIDIAATALASIIITLDPDAIVFGGGLSGVPEIYPHLAEALPNYLFGNVTAPALLPPMHGDSSGVRGAAILGAASAS